MIKSEKGKVEIRGLSDDIPAELSMIIISLLRANFTKKDIIISMEAAFERYDEDYKEVCNGSGKTV